MLINLSFQKLLESRLREPAGLIQVIMGPRQVGKTTAVDQTMTALAPEHSFHYAAADAVFRSDWTWVERQWALAEAKGAGTILILDEIQKIDNWSEIIKKLWDANKKSPTRLKVVILGSSSLALQSGLSESLSGRFEMIRAHHWSFLEAQAAFGSELDDYLIYGGYPGAHAFSHDPPRWLSYMRTSIVETVLEKDIMQLRRVTRPALFKQVFELLCSYPAAEISLRKLVGQLQDPGSIATVQHYIELLEGAFLCKVLSKFGTNTLQRKASSPKIIPLCPALCTFARGDTLLNPELRGRLFEMIIGIDLLRLPGELSYWRIDQDEVDYVYKQGQKVVAIEVKSGRKKSPHGLIKFKQHFPKASGHIITPETYLDFAAAPLRFLHL